MKPRPKPQESGSEELFRSKLKNIINLRHELVRLGELIDWRRLEEHFAPYYKQAGRPGLPIRLVVGLHLLKHIEGLSDEAVCERWERDPYMQYFCGEEYFQHSFPLERSGMTHFRNRVGDEALETLLQETLAAAHRGGALSVRATEAVAVDTTVQEKAIAHPTEHGLMLAAIEQLGAQAKKSGLSLRQSYVRVARYAAMKTGRYLHAQQKKRARRQLKFMRVRLRRLIRDVRRKMARVPAEWWNGSRVLSAGPGESRIRSEGTAVISIPGMPPRWNASAREKRAPRTNSAAKFPLPPICIRQPVGTSFCRRGHCTEIPTMVTR
jgi:IS5 family transposase